MFAVDEATATAIRRSYEESGELGGIVESAAITSTAAGISFAKAVRGYAVYRLVPSSSENLASSASNNVWIAVNALSSACITPSQFGTVTQNPGTLSTSEENATLEMRSVSSPASITLVATNLPDRISSMPGKRRCMRMQPRYPTFSTSFPVSAAAIGR